MALAAGPRRRRRRPARRGPSSTTPRSPSTTSSRADHDALPDLVEALGPVEVCTPPARGRRRGAARTGVAAFTDAEAPADARRPRVGDLAGSLRGLGRRDRPSSAAVTSPLATKRAIDVLGAGVTTDVGLRGGAAAGRRRPPRGHRRGRRGGRCPASSQPGQRSSCRPARTGGDPVRAAARRRSCRPGPAEDDDAAVLADATVAVLNGTGTAGLRGAARDPAGRRGVSASSAPRTRPPSTRSATTVSLRPRRPGGRGRRDRCSPSGWRRRPRAGSTARRLRGRARRRAGHRRRGPRRAAPTRRTRSADVLIGGEPGPWGPTVRGWRRALRLAAAVRRRARRAVARRWSPPGRPPASCSAAGRGNLTRVAVGRSSTSPTAPSDARHFLIVGSDSRDGLTRESSASSPSARAVRRPAQRHHDLRVDQRGPSQVVADLPPARPRSSTRPAGGGKLTETVRRRPRRGRRGAPATTTGCRSTTTPSLARRVHRRGRHARRRRDRASTSRWSTASPGADFDRAGHLRHGRRPRRCRSCARGRGRLATTSASRASRPSCAPCSAS